MNANTEEPAKDEQQPGAGPAPRVLTDDELSRLLSDQQFGVLSFVRRSGHPHLSTVLYDWHPVERVLRISATADRLKVRYCETHRGPPCMYRGRTSSRSPSARAMRRSRRRRPFPVTRPAENCSP